MTQLMAIINVTPDSFSDGGTFFDTRAAFLGIKQAIADGAAVIDVGAESTRPGAIAVSAAQELSRLNHVFAGLTSLELGEAVLSIDTRHPETAQAALQAGFHWVNDVEGFSNPAMIDVVKSSDCKLVVMHSLGAPADRNVNLPEGCNVIEGLLAFADRRFSELFAVGIAHDRLIFDPGIGFGKTAQQSWEIIDHVARLEVLDVPLLVGHSRKSFLAAMPGSRDEATLTVSERLIDQGVDYLRVHDVKAHRALLEQ